MNKKPFVNALVCGRMQGFHKGHQHLIDTALSVAERCVVLLGSSQEQGTKKNPFSVTTRTEIIKILYPGNEVIVGSIPDLEEHVVNEAWSRHVLDTFKQYTREYPDIYVYGYESDQDNSNWFKCSREIIELSKHMTEICLSRSKFNISGTQMREWLFMDEYDKWAAHIHPHLRLTYDRLRSELLNAPGLKDSVRMHLKPKQSWTDRPIYHIT